MLNDALKIKHTKKKKKISIRRKLDYNADCLSLGICVRYAEEPFNKSKIITFINRYIFINRLPFDIKIVNESANKVDNFFIYSNKGRQTGNKLYDINKHTDMIKMDETEKKKNKSLYVENSSHWRSECTTHSTYPVEDGDIYEINITDVCKLSENNKTEEKVLREDKMLESSELNMSKLNRIKKNTDGKNRLSKITAKNNDTNEIFSLLKLKNPRGSIGNMHNDSHLSVMDHCSINDTNDFLEYIGVYPNKKKKIYSEVNETYIKRGEIASFHSLRNYIKIKDNNDTYVSLPFSLIPKNVPTHFQIELLRNGTMRNKYSGNSNIMENNINTKNSKQFNTNNVQNLLVEVNICSGLFGDKQQIPYTYNGYFYILSLPLRPHFEIINATKFIIAYVTDFNKYTRKHINNNYDLDVHTNKKDVNSSIKIVNPHSCIYYTLGNNDEKKNSKIALKIVGVQKSSWCINTINSFIDNVVTIPFSVLGNDAIKRKKFDNDKIKKNYTTLKRSNPIYNKHENTTENTFLLNPSVNNMKILQNSIHNSYNVYNEELDLIDKKEELSLKKKKKYGEVNENNSNVNNYLVNKKVFSFLIIRDNGSRAIVITGNYKMARKVVNMKNFSKIHKFIALNKIKKIISNKKNKNRKYLLNYKKRDFVYFNFPNIPIIYNFRVPRITFTWIHRQDVIIAMHLTDLNYRGHINPKEVVNDDINQMFTPINILKKKQIEEYIQLVFLNSYIESVFVIEQIHIDHFVKGDIPVILKNTYIEGDDKKDTFLYVHIKQYCVDSVKQAPIYQSITIKMSPINANIELLVIEKLIEIAEKEKALLMLHGKNKDAFVPPVINTSKTAKNAINTTLKLFSDINFLNMLHMNDLMRDQLGVNFLLQNSNITSKSLLNEHRSGIHLNNISCMKNTKNTYLKVRDMPTNNFTGRALIYPAEKNNMKEMYITKSVQSNTQGSKKHHLLYYKHLSNKFDLDINSNIIGDKYKSFEHSTIDSKKKKLLKRKVSKILTGYYKYKKINNLINKTYYNIHNINDEHLLPIKIQYFKRHKIFMKAFSSHIFLHPNPRWIDDTMKPVYIRELKIYPIDIIASIRTSEHRISRRVLHIVDALPLDTPSMRIHLLSQKRNYVVCTWNNLFQSLRISYFRQLFRQSLPSAWLSNPFALITGFLKGLHVLLKESMKGLKTNSNCFDGLMSGIKCGVIILVVNTVGGLFQSISHMLNVCHKLMGGSRPRPPSILDSIIIGFDGLISDTFYRPWAALFVEPKISINKGNSTFKTICIVIGCILRCLIAPIFGLLNLLASLTEGFANTLIGDFERFSRIQERGEFETDNMKTSYSLVMKKRKKKRRNKKKIKYD